MTQIKLFHDFQIGKLSSTYLVKTDNIDKAYMEIKKFIAVFLNIESPDYENLSHPDLHICQKDESSLKAIRLDQTRALNDFMSKTSIVTGKRVAVILQADLMNINAANSCLKTLEESGRDSLIILISQHPDAIISTILSRCQKFNLLFQNNDIVVNQQAEQILGLLMNTENNEEVIKYANSFASRPREDWCDFSNYMLELLGNCTKRKYKIQPVKNIYSESEVNIYNKYFADLPIWQLLVKYEDMQLTISQTLKFDLELRAATQLIFAKFTQNNYV